MIKKLLRAIASIILVTLWLAACAPSANPTVVPTLTSQVIQTQTVSREAQVQSVEIQMINTASVQVNAVVRGMPSAQLIEAVHRSQRLLRQPSRLA